MNTPRIVPLVAAVALFTACDQKRESTARAELKQVDGDSFQIIPTEGQYPYCLVFTRSETGVIRQLTMIHGNLSVPCEAGKPIGNVKYRVPVREGTVKVHVLFSDQRLNAGSIAQEIYERKGDPSFHPMDLRLPGNVQSQTFEFKPRARDDEPTVGGQIGAGGEIVPPEATGGEVTADGGTSAVEAPEAESATGGAEQQLGGSDGGT